MGQQDFTKMSSKKLNDWYEDQVGCQIVEFDAEVEAERRRA